MLLVNSHLRLAHFKMKFASQILMFLCFFASLYTTGQETNLTVAKFENQKVKFLADTVYLKNIFQQIVKESNIEGVQNNGDTLFFDKISVEGGNLKNNEKYYFLLAVNIRNKLKVAILLAKRKNKLILFKTSHLSEEEIDLNSSFVICYGTDLDCFPTLYIDEGKKYWTSTSSELMYCDPDDPCKQVVGLLNF